MPPTGARSESLAPAFVRGPWDRDVRRATEERAADTALTSREPGRIGVCQPCRQLSRPRLAPECRQMKDAGRSGDVPASAARRLTPTPSAFAAAC